MQPLNVEWWSAGAMCLRQVRVGRGVRVETARRGVTVGVLGVPPRKVVHSPLMAIPV